MGKGKVLPERRIIVREIHKEKKKNRFINLSGEFSAVVNGKSSW